MFKRKRRFARLEAPAGLSGLSHDGYYILVGPVGSRGLDSSLLTALNAILEGRGGRVVYGYSDVEMLNFLGRRVIADGVCRGVEAMARVCG
jgi:hypothetical protein